MNWEVGDFQFLKSGSDEPCIQPIESSQLGRLERAFALATAVQPLLDRLRREGVPDWRDALRGGALTPEQAAEIEAAEAAVAGVLAVDDFVPQELTGRGR
ncbi:acyl-CoA dehydrogenase domain-containing protein [Bordetella pertussis]|uniref:acyl-CoA dehydrogenase domain-containing protein n=1 Tax=Bordetella pertussis TaxID=520 RepID=UPI000FDADC28|nr:acyl-CoA dehydrogenase domain-containing protein [Bordetella pertussis]AZW77138.1 hypothetical protein CXD92_00215 [Bordetella pertussis]AZX02301.1 hypothetical protein CG029_00215 [Bordetella pertussis]WNQ87439.1 DUF1974 domain-containing protein [Bordetella pertussis]